MMNSTNARALVVEDDPSWQQILSEILTDLGLSVDVANNLEEAVADLRAVPHRLAVVDLSLNGSDHRNRDGLLVLDAARRYDPGCTTLLLTGYATVELAVGALTEYGALTCLRKETFNRSKFRDLIREHFLTNPTNRSGAIPDNGSAKVDGRIALEPSASDSTAGMALIVEDDAGWRSLLSELLIEVGYQVRMCNGFGEAMGCLNRERFALAVVDLSLANHTALPSLSHRPDSQEQSETQQWDGYRLLSRTRAAGIPTIVVTGVANSSDIEFSFTEFGIFACHEKQTFDRHAFLRTASEVQLTGKISQELADLTGRERQVLSLLAQGMTNKDIAEILMISTNTVKRHLKSIFRKLGVHTRATAVSIAIRAGLSPG